MNEPSPPIFHHSSKQGVYIMDHNPTSPKKGHGLYKEGSIEPISRDIDKTTDQPEEEERFLLAHMPIQVNGEEIRRIVSAAEAEYLSDVFEQNTEKSEGELDETDLSAIPLNPVNTTDCTTFVAYGIIAPQAGTDNKAWKKRHVVRLLKEFKGKLLQTVHFENEDEAFETFIYHDFFCDYEYRRSQNVPCAFLMSSSCDYPKILKAAGADSDYLGAAMSPAFSGLSVPDNILNRDFVIVIRSIEPAFDGNMKRWMKHICDEDLIRASRLK